MPDSTALIRLSRPVLLLAGVTVALLLAVPPLAGQALAAKTCGGKKVTIMGTPGDDTIVGKGASDVIFGAGGDDTIIGGRNGNDTICGGPGNDVLKGGKGYDSLYGEGGDDTLYGETGSDMLDGGGGDDKLYGEKGSDTEHGGQGDDFVIGSKGPDDLEGGSGKDYVDGQQGSDEVLGDAGDDRLLGDKGNDKILGGAGEDRLEGGPGDDPDLNGGGGSDEVLGGAGIDDANGGDGDGDIVRGDSGTDDLSGGPGANDIVSYASATRGGVKVNLALDKAKGDGHDDLADFEDVVGSPQADEIVGDGEGNKLDGGVGNDELASGGAAGEAYGGPGDDECNGFTVENSCGPEEGPPAGGAFVVLNRGLDGSSLVVQGGSGNDGLAIGQVGEGWTVTDSVPIFAGDGCLPTGPNSVLCPGEPQLALIVVTGGDGNDGITIEPSVPGSAHVRANGNAGNDDLLGGQGDDVREAGENYNDPNNGNDRLDGNGGADVLYADPGADVLVGGPGNDLLVNAVPVCQGNTYDGGPGIDTVSYGRSTTGVDATLGGSGGPPGCGSPDQVMGNNESLEGSDGPDTLIGDNGPNSFLGHLGADTFIGKGGNDFIDSADDGQHDKKIDCGPGDDDEAAVDKPDPHPISC